MDDRAKYLIRADVVADGVVERSDVVGAIFGQTEGLLGDDLDLRDLQQTSKVGRIDVTIESEGGRSAGVVTIASRLDRVETAILAAALETIDRVGPCASTFEVRTVEDVRQAKRREVVDRAKELLATAFDEDLMSSEELIEEVRESVRVERITEYEGLPAGPRVATSDAIILVEGRADVLRLLRYGVKNAVAVEGTNVPDAIAELTRDRTVTAFLDGDRGGDLILRELGQVADIDFVAVAPEGRSVENLDRGEVHRALRDKVPFETALAEVEVEAEAEAETEADGEGERDGAPAAEADASSDSETTGSGTAATDGSSQPAPDAAPDRGPALDPRPDPPDPGGAAIDADGEGTGPTSLGDHVDAVDGSGAVRLLDREFALLEEAPVGDAFGIVADADPPPATIVLDGELSQRLLDVAAQRGVDQVVARELGEFTKRPTSVRIRTVEELRATGS